MLRFFLGLALLAAAAPSPSICAQQGPPYRAFTNVTGLVPLGEGSISTAELGFERGAELLLTGLNAGGVPFSQLYTPTGETFSVSRGDTTFNLSLRLINQPFEAVWQGRSLWYDFDGDGDLDLALAGARSTDAPFDAATRLYARQEGQQYPFVQAGALTGVYAGAFAAGDLYGDGRAYLVYTGYAAPDQPFFGIARVDRKGDAFAPVPVLETYSDGAGNAALALGDCDGDGDLDVVFTGLDAGGAPTARLLRNTGAGWVPVAQARFPGVFNGALAAGDVDGDGDDDFVVTGATYGPAMIEHVARLYRSQDCQLTPDEAAPLPALSGNTALFRDMDGDGDLDLLVNGYAGSVFAARALFYVFENTGAGAFSLYQMDQGVLFGSAAWADVNGNGRLDVLLAGYRNGELVFKVMRAPGPTLSN